MVGMERKSRRCIRMAALPSVEVRKYVQIIAKGSRKMLPSSSSPRSRRGDNPSRSNTPSNELPELSDVPCYTCRRRHVRCDRILPSCAKCRKKGVQCLGYQKPLRWADGVAVRGKLKGKSKPVVDSNVMSIVRGNVQQQADTAMKEAAQIGLYTADNCCNDVVADESQYLELIAYHNSKICAERITSEETQFINQHIAPLSHETAQRLPRSIVNCILGIAAVHMASRNPGNRALERLALETKVNVFQSHNRLLQMPQDQIEHQPDVVICSGILIFAMDLFEHGMSRWMVHTLGSMNVMSSLGGIESLSYYYPHLQAPFFHVSHFETMWIVLSHVPITKPKQATRRALEILSHASLTNRKGFNPCPIPLTLAIWDVGACSQSIFGSGNPISFNDMHKREQILLDVLSFQPRVGSQAAADEYHRDSQPSSMSRQTLDITRTAWKAAVTILVLRYLYFGRPDLMPHSHGRRSPTPSLATQTGASYARNEELGAYYQNADEFDMSEFVDESTDTETVSDYLTAGPYLPDPLSRSPSPLPSLLHYTEPPSSNIWNTRYDIHDEAFATLFTALTALHDEVDPVSSRYIIMPVLILALVTRPQSKERALCLSFLAKFKSFMASAPPGEIGGAEFNVIIPWEKLDAYSEVIARERQDSVVSAKTTMAQSAPEWNWWDVLLHIDLNVSWPVACGTSHLESSSESWAFRLISSVVNDDCFNSWLREPAPSRSSTSSA
ncbi:hypothetical protein K458DRAFT_151697 [Lentithecium fluviatile CBS 122367]|uniref:Zn(2)-C6 fungal-type domain-containing protein n=1 Tax=Lentithecium fluviatile CBS 122367 TaxID=1168545 RepID=A0A6G1JDT2_9PLEO|nr:hypothetical protein K458DRAFT_151697 [Lentithecium fluviatile CBS 122367]